MQATHPFSRSYRTTLATCQTVVGRAKTTSRLRHPMIRLSQTTSRLRHPMKRLRQTMSRLRHPMKRFRQTMSRLRHPMKRLSQTMIRLRHQMMRLSQTTSRFRHPMMRLCQTMSLFSAPMKGEALGYRPSAQLNFKLGIVSRKKAQKAQKERGWRELLGHPHGESSRAPVSSYNPSFGVFCVSLRPITFPDPESRPSLLFHPPHSPPHRPHLLR